MLRELTCTVRNYTTTRDVTGALTCYHSRGRSTFAIPRVQNAPKWETGSERAVATSQCIAVATRGDAEGSKLVEVHQGASSPPEADAIAFDGELSLTGSDVLVGKYTYRVRNTA